MQALRRLVDHVADRLEHAGVGEPLDDVVIVANRKCSDITPACGEMVAVLAEEMMAKSMSPAFTSCSTCGSCPSCAPGYWSIEHRALAQFLELVGEQVAGDG
jgi:hypothetical protein